MTDITPIIELLVTVLAALCSIVIIPYIKTKLNRAQLDQAQQMASQMMRLMPHKQ